MRFAARSRLVIPRSASELPPTFIVDTLRNESESSNSSSKLDIVVSSDLLTSESSLAAQSRGIPEPVSLADRREHNSECFFCPSSIPK